jgi:transcriptional antiterminator Rof (Rho-off)
VCVCVCVCVCVHVYMYQLHLKQGEDSDTEDADTGCRHWLTENFVMIESNLTDVAHREGNHPPTQQHTH